MQRDKTVSVIRARQLLGSLSHTLSDDQVSDILCALTLLAREQLCYNGSKKATSQYEPQSEFCN